MALPAPGSRYALQKFDADGVTDEYNISFADRYLSKDYVYARAYDKDTNFNEEQLTVTFVSESSDSSRVRVTPLQAAGRVVEIFRYTPRASPLVDFRDRSMLTAENLNTVTRQTVHAVAEVEDQSLANREAVLAAAAEVERVSGLIDNIYLQAKADIIASYYLVPVQHVPGIVVNRPNQTVSYMGSVYAPVPEALPFTTGSFDPAKWRLIQGLLTTDLNSPLMSAQIGHRPSGTGRQDTRVGAALDAQATNFLSFCTPAQVAAIRSGDTSVSLLSAWTAMHAQLAATGGGGVYFPEGTYSYSQDVRFLTRDINLLGAGARTVLRATNNARLIFGQATEIPGTPKNSKGGVKLINVTVQNMAIRPADNHSGEVVLVDFADRTTFRDLYGVHPYANDGSTLTHGIKLNWVQWCHMDNVETQVNGAGVYINLPGVTQENEDHYSFINCQFFGSKSKFAGFNPVGVLLDRAANRNAPVWQFEMVSCHFGKFTNDDANTEMDGIRFKTSYTSDNLILANAVFSGCWWEAVDYPFNFARQMGTVADGSHLVLKGCTFMKALRCFHGTDFSKTSASVDGCYFLQCGQVAKGVRMYFQGRNRLGQPTTTGRLGLVDEGISRIRLASRGTQGSVDGVRVENRGIVTLPAGTTSVVVNHGLTALGDGLTPDNVMVSSRNNGFAYCAAITATTMTVLMADTPTPSNRVVDWRAEIIEN